MRLLRFLRHFALNCLNCLTFLTRTLNLIISSLFPTFVLFPISACSFFDNLTVSTQHVPFSNSITHQPVPFLKVLPNTPNHLQLIYRPVQEYLDVRDIALLPNLLLSPASYNCHKSSCETLAVSPTQPSTHVSNVHLPLLPPPISALSPLF